MFLFINYTNSELNYCFTNLEQNLAQEHGDERVYASGARLQLMCQPTLSFQVVRSTPVASVDSSRI